jgi:hypothetical protein
VFGDVVDEPIPIFITGDILLSRRLCPIWQIGSLADRSFHFCQVCNLRIFPNFPGAQEMTVPTLDLPSRFPTGAEKMAVLALDFRSRFPVNPWMNRPLWACSDAE